MDQPRRPDTMTDDDNPPNGGEPRDRPFNPFRVPRTEKSIALVAEVLNELTHYEEHFGLRKRARRAVDQDTFERIVAALIADLSHRALTVPEGRVAITQSKQLLGRTSRYGSPVLSKTLPSILKMLCSPELAFAERRLGGKSPFPPYPALQSTMVAGSRLLSRLRERDVGREDLGTKPGGETIILKRAKEGHGDRGKWIEYQDDDVTRLYRSQMAEINGRLAAASIEFDSVAGPERHVDTTDRFLQRYFNNGRFNQGGRLFGGFWQGLKKKQRAAGLIIDDENVVTLDYVQMAPRILYGMAKATPPEGDAYEVPSPLNQ